MSPFRTLWRWRRARVQDGCDAAGPFYRRPGFFEWLELERVRKRTWKEQWDKMTPRQQDDARRAFRAIWSPQ